MRRRLALSVVGLAIAASVVPLTSASAVCSAAWQQVFGQCSPCQTAGPAYDNLNRRVGGVLPVLNCVA